MPDPKERKKHVSSHLSALKSFKNHPVLQPKPDEKSSEEKTRGEKKQV